MTVAAITLRQFPLIAAQARPVTGAGSFEALLEGGDPVCAGLDEAKAASFGQYGVFAPQRSTTVAMQDRRIAPTEPGVFSSFTQVLTSAALEAAPIFPSKVAVAEGNATRAIPTMVIVQSAALAPRHMAAAPGSAKEVQIVTLDLIPALTKAPALLASQHLQQPAASLLSPRGATAEATPSDLVLSVFIGPNGAQVVARGDGDEADILERISATLKERGLTLARLTLNGRGVALPRSTLERK